MTFTSMKLMLLVGLQLLLQGITDNQEGNNGGMAVARAAMMALDVIGLDYEFNKVNLFEGEHLKPEYKAVNPMHTVPCLVDGDLTLNESRAINIYLAQKYDTKLNLLPKDPAEAAKVHQRLYFDSGSLWDNFAKLFVSYRPFSFTLCLW